MRISENVKMVNKTTVSHVVVLFIFVSLQFIPYFATGQSVEKPVEISNILDSAQNIYGKSDMLVNGSVYYQPNPQATGTPFLFSSLAEEGVVYTRGVEFSGISLNYDIASQKLLLLNIMPDGVRLYINLSDVLVDSFLIRDYFFVATEKLNIKSYFPYLIPVNSGRYIMYMGYKKEFINRFDDRNPYGKFSSTKHTLYLVYDSIPVRINSKKAFLKTFPSARKEISTYLRKQKIKLLRATPEELKLLMDFYNKQRELAHE